ncbi:MAG: RNA 2',3'-cyclic phosphodiesterase [Candidatus Doudnabacteria bacterium]|nr:RNA 2',3'-cyclic phosphodiesterase [Candidatus Doudnabacteria bacterium]
MRLFTAIPLPDDIKQTAGEITRGRLPVPYVNTGNLHVTLNFFGELTDAEADKAKKVFADTSKGFEKFSVEFDQLVKFNDQIHLTILPNERLSLLQSILEKAFERLSLLQSILEKAFLAAGFKFQDRPYYPHVKLTNLHMDKVMNQERKLDNFPHEELKQLNFEADKVAIFETKLLLHHPKHIPLVEIKLL